MPTSSLEPGCFCRRYGQVRGLFNLARALALCLHHAPCPMASVHCALSWVGANASEGDTCSPGWPGAGKDLSVLVWGVEDR